jgi:hypothetical protein
MDRRVLMLKTIHLQVQSHLELIFQLVMRIQLRTLVVAV